jgi:predicted dienelactone hydrolase
MIGTMRARRIARIALIAVITGVALSAMSCSGGSAAKSTTPTASALRDPAERGPYNVGLTKMTFERPANADGSPRKLETWIWYPAAGAATDPTPAADAAPADNGGPFPVVIFSHGSGGQPNFYKYVTEHLASWGFIVAAPPHPGNTSADCFPCSGASITASARERPTDVTFVLDQVLALKDDPSQPLGKVIDPAHTAVAGHSFGGWTSVFAAPGSKFNAVIAMAPGLPETLLGRAPNITAPILILGGDKDELVPPGSVRKLFDALPKTIARTYVSFPEGHHLTFSDRCLGCTAALSEARGHDLVNRYVTAFLETYVKGDDRYAHYLTEDVAPEAVIVHDASASGN